MLPKLPAAQALLLAATVYPIFQMNEQTDCLKQFQVNKTIAAINCGFVLNQVKCCRDRKNTSSRAWTIFAKSKKRFSCWRQDMVYFKIWNNQGKAFQLIPRENCKSTKHFKNFGTTDMFSILIYVIKKGSFFSVSFYETANSSSRYPD